MSSFLDSTLDALEASLVTLLSLTSARVYRGLRPREATQGGGGLEVWLRPTGARSQLSGVGVVTHTVEVHLRVRKPSEGTKTGGAKVDQIADAEELVRRAYDGTRALSVTDLVCTAVPEGMLPGDEDGPELLDKYLTLLVSERS